MSLLSWLKGLRKQNEDDEENPLPEGGIDALRADQAATQQFGVTPEQAARIAKRKDE